VPRCKKVKESSKEILKTSIPKQKIATMSKVITIHIFVLFSRNKITLASKFNIKIITGSDYINISNGNNVNSINCYIDGQTNTTFANIYYNTMYKNNYYGSSGGSVTRLPYFGYYNLIELKDSKTHENCGNLIVSFNEDKKPLFTYSKSDPIDGLLIDNGHILTNK